MCKVTLILMCVLVANQLNGLHSRCPAGPKLQPSLIVTDDGPASNNSTIVFTVNYSTGTRAKHIFKFSPVGHSASDDSLPESKSVIAHDEAIAAFKFETNQTFEQRNLRVTIWLVVVGDRPKKLAEATHSFVVCKEKPSRLKVTDNGPGIGGVTIKFTAYYSLGSRKVLLFQFVDLDMPLSPMFALSDGEKAITEMLYLTDRWTEKFIKVTVWYGKIKMDQVIHRFTISKARDWSFLDELQKLPQIFSVNYKHSSATLPSSKELMNTSSCINGTECMMIKLEEEEVKKKQE